MTRKHLQRIAVLFVMANLLVGLPSHAAFLSSSHAPSVIDLSGTWQFAMGTKHYQDRVTLPGSMLTNDKGEKPSLTTPWIGSIYDSSYYHNPVMAPYRRKDNIKFPFFLTPNRHYVGTAWYARKVTVPRDWKGQRVVFFMERPHIETTVFVNGQQAGHRQSLSVPHEYDITPYIIYGGDNTLEVEVYNGIDHVGVGQDSHSVTDQTQGDWNGIVGRLELQAHPMAGIIGMTTIPNVKDKTVRVQLSFQGRSRHKVRFSLWPNDLQSVVQVSDSVYDLKLTTVRLWDEFSPNRYHLSATTQRETVTTTFGMREISVDGRQIILNGHPIFLRGTVENCNFPLTGYPPTDVDSWLAIFRKCKAYGLNHMRFHSYCPPEAAFVAADSVGFYLQPEGPSWPNHGVKLGRGMVIDDYLMKETQRMVRQYGNHPSFTMLCAGNEPAGNWVSWTNRFVDYWKAHDGRRIYAGASVGGGWAWDSHSEYHVKGGARGLEWDRQAPQAADDHYQQILYPRNYKDSVPNNSPVIAHEQGQWCAFPDFNEINQYTGVYKACNFEIFRDLLRHNGMATMDRKFLMASGKLQTLAYKYDIERNLRTKDYAGFALLGLNDYSGQGTALVGVLNVFWKEKGYTTAKEWRQWCAPVVPLACLPKFVYDNQERLKVPVEVYNAYRDLGQVQLSYRLTDGDKMLSHNILYDGSLSLGKHRIVEGVEENLSFISRPTKLQLQLQLQSADSVWHNSYELWVYPHDVPAVEAKNIYITDSLDAKALRTLKDGGKVLITAGGKVTLGSDVSHHYLPVFWNTSWFKMRPPHTTGAYIQKDHPVFADFPTDDWQNLNWWELVNRTQVMNLMEFPADFQPIVQPIDTWHVSRKLAMLLEVNVGRGKLLMTTMDISRDLNHRPVARQLRYSILRYMNSTAFQPQTTVEPSVIADLFTKHAPAVNMFTNESPDELKPKLTE